MDPPRYSFERAVTLGGVRGGRWKMGLGAGFCSLSTGVYPSTLILSFCEPRLDTLLTVRFEDVPLVKKREVKQADFGGRVPTYGPHW